MNLKGKVSEFFKEVSKNEKLRKEISGAEKDLGKNLSKEEIKDFFQKKFLPIAKKYGFDFTYEDLKKYKKSMEPKKGNELEDDMLEMVTGGGDCMCFYGGGGPPKDDNDTACACFLGGYGKNNKLVCALVGGKELAR